MRLSRTILIGSLAFTTSCGGAVAQLPVATPTSAPTVSDLPTTEPEPTEVETTEAPLVSSADGQVDLVMRDYMFELNHSGSDVPMVTFAIDNQGKVSHELIVLRTDLGGRDLPLDAKSNVDEEGAGVEVADRLEGILYQSSQVWSTELAPGQYVLVCNLPSHYRRGMWAEFDIAG